MICSLDGCKKKAAPKWSFQEIEYCSRACRNIGWVQAFCIVPDGKFVGKRVDLRGWQRDIFRGIFNRKTRRAIISVGRKNAKTALSAMLLLLFLCGPESRPNSELYSTALSRDQASIIFRLAAKMVRLNEALSGAITVRDTAKELYCERRGTLYKALSADASTSYGLSPVFTVHDELGQVKGPSHPLYEALETATGAQENPLTVVISTQAPTDNDLLSVLIDDAEAENDPETRLFLYAAPEDADPFDIETIKMANPAFDDFQNAKETLAMAESARRMPSREASYRNLVLNQRVEVYSPFITKAVWSACGDNPTKGGKVFAGLDLSEVNDLTALVLLHSNGGKYHIEPHFWLPEHEIEERSRQDRVPYDVWAKNGFLHLAPGKSIEYQYVAKRLADAFDKYDLRKVAFDRYKMRHLRPWLVYEGLSEAFIDERFEDFGQGFVSMAPALDTAESMILNEKICHGDHPVLTMCAANAVVKRDEAGNRKLDKKRSRGRIDGMVALVMACAVANENSNAKPTLTVDLSEIMETA